MSEFHLPRYQDRDQPLDAAALDELPRAIEDREEREVVRQFLVNAKLDGDQTMGDVLRRFEDASPAGIRAIVDEARAGVGLDTLDDHEAHEKFVAHNAALRTGPQRDRLGRAHQVCAAEDCTVHEVDASGVWVPVPHSRYWCRAHVDQAQPGDLDPIPPARINLATMSPCVSPQEQRRLQAEQDQLRQGDRARAERRKAEAEAVRKARANYEATHPPRPIAGVPPALWPR
jgi:hypothetical protein